VVELEQKRIAGEVCKESKFKKLKKLCKEVVKQVTKQALQQWGYEPLKKKKPEELRVTIKKMIRTRKSRTLESEIENIMYEIGLTNKNKGDYAVHLETIKDVNNANHFTTIWQLPRGLLYKDYINKRKYFADGLTALVDVKESKGVLVIDVFKGVIPSKVKYSFNTIEYLDNYVLPMPLGVNQRGLNIIELTNVVHYLIAGYTGSGKTVLIKSWIDALLQNPNVLLFVIDLALIDFIHVKDCAVFASEIEEALKIILFLKQEMIKRKYYLADFGLDIVKYNVKYPQNKLPYMVLFIDEFAFTAPGKYHTKEEKRIRNMLQGTIAELSQQARKVGIHLIICMQRPDKDLISPIIKNNLIGRICFRCADRGHSQTVLNSTDAFYLSDADGRLLSLYKGNLVEAQALYLDSETARERAMVYGEAKKKTYASYYYKGDDIINEQISGNNKGLLQHGQQDEYQKKRLLPR